MNYWTIIAKVHPMFNTDSIFRSSLSSIFQTSSKDHITINEFILSIAILFNRSTFMSIYHLIYDVLDKNKTGILDTSVFSDLPTFTEKDLLFHVKYPNGEMEITRTLFIHIWSRFIEKLTAGEPISCDIFTSYLQNHNSVSILVFPFCINKSVEALYT
jgi:hypothetical protein